MINVIFKRTFNEQQFSSHETNTSDSENGPTVDFVISFVGGFAFATRWHGNQNRVGISMQFFFGVCVFVSLVIWLNGPLITSAVGWQGSTEYDLRNYTSL